ncbi:MAG: tRNA (adenosine(37)-N6)-threonylcarbamoyltransferase complex ATPase subunit type 1 TsaE [Sediminibacterium sp.]|nr:tRNA (adenosine(37)-N6)-threonylcarbamoyltransferase complex ATPase subunit type 1 TsaE [Sediminibacterium sp.]
MEIIYHITQVEQIASYLIDEFKTIKCWFLNGELGAGKTTLIKSFGQYLKVKEKVTSPSFALVHEYKTIDNKEIAHIDLYRLNKESELSEIHFEEIINQKDFTFIEWGKKFPQTISKQSYHLSIDISILDIEYRKLTCHKSFPIF